MLKTETEQLFRRVMQETNAQFTDEQVSCIVQAMLKICARITEEAMNNRGGNSGRGSGGGFFAG